MNIFYKNISQASDAAYKLGIKSESDYKKRHKEDPRLPSNPEQKYATWTKNGGLDGFLKKIKYQTLEQASKAMIALNIHSIVEYKIRYKEDPRLPSNPHVYYNDFTSWIEFLGREKKEYYESLEQASKAAIALNIKNGTEYKIRYKEDPRLPSNPPRYYNDLTSWIEFLGGEKKEYYESLEQASKAAIALNIHSLVEYHICYKKDPRLPSNPQNYYKNFTNWIEFLGGEKKDYYESLEQASKAAQALNIQTIIEYKNRYKEDPRLPSNPPRYYNDFTNWIEFLGGEKKEYYESLEQASKVAQALNIKNGLEYQNRYKEDPRLHSSPNQYYDNFTNFTEFLGIEKDNLDNLSLSGEFNSWGVLALEFTEKGRNIDKNKRVLSAFIHEFIIKFDYPKRPEAFLSNQTKINNIEYESFLNYFSEKSKTSFHTIVINFVDFLLKKLCYIEDEDNGGFSYLAGYSNQIKNVESDLFEIKKEKLTESDKPVLAYSYVCEAKKWIVPEYVNNFNDLKHLHNVTSVDWFDVDPTLIDINDPDCVFRQITKRIKIDGKKKKTEVTQIWSPVRFLALYVLLNVPLRGQQILWLDSGEADKQIPTIAGNKVEWKFNQSKLVSLRKSKNEQGFLKKYKDGVGMFVTTNKTGTSEGGYSISWIQEELIPWMIKLRDWQSKYNPLKKLTNWTDIKTGSSINQSILKMRGANCFLFREFGSVSPPKVQTIFSTSLPFVLNKIERENNKLTEALDNNDNLISYKTIYTPHAMRVSIITALVMDGDMAIEIVSKLVGHASIVMTIYYTKVNYAQNKRAFSEAEKKALANSPLRIQEEILTKSIESVKSELLGNNPDFFNRLDKAWPNSAYQYSDIGICPMGGARCDVGGEEIEGLSDKYGAVPAGHLGDRNCPRCRFFITGTGFIGGLIAVGNEISNETNVIKRQLDKLEDKISELDTEQYRCSVDDKPFKNQLLLDKKRSERESVGRKHAMYIADFISIFRLAEQSLSLINKTSKTKNPDGTDKTNLITNSNFTDFSIGLDETSEFHHLSEICESSEIYSLVNPSRATIRKTQMLDNMMRNNELPPMLFSLTEDQQLEVGKEMTRLLLNRFKTWERVDSVINNNLMLDDLTQGDELVSVKNEILDILDKNSPPALNNNNIVNIRNLNELD